MFKTTSVVLAILTLAACGSTPVAAPAPTPAAETFPPVPTQSANPGFGITITDAGGVQRARLDPATVKATECRTTADNYGGPETFYGAESTFRVKNASALRGTVSLNVQYQAEDGTVVSESVAGANNIRPGQSAVIGDSTGVEKGDLPGDKVRCEVVEAEVYVPMDQP
ncbi:hypothetical protein [Nonomuraea sp. NPDC050786]|uniref:hypothetical protein n=1 Tax=Nonomuraea sp. NPDC050786 TaxID=3154840 RepID=UPI0033ED2AE2